MNMTGKMAEVGAFVRQVHGDILADAGLPLGAPQANAKTAVRCWMMPFHPVKAESAELAAQSLVQLPVYFSMVRVVLNQNFAAITECSGDRRAPYVSVRANV